MRYEAKHSYFKQLALSMGNFINIEHSLAMRHQLLQCYLHSDISNIPVDHKSLVCLHVPLHGIYKLVLL